MARYILMADDNESPEELAPKKERRHSREWYDKFFEVFSVSANVTEAAKAAEVTRTTVYEHREKYDDFKKRFEGAAEESTDLLEKEAERRAVKGWEEPVFYKGEECGQVTKYSNTLLIFLLKARRPDKYRERFDHRMSGNIGVKLYDKDAPIDEI